MGYEGLRGSAYSTQGSHNSLCMGVHMERQSGELHSMILSYRNPSVLLTRFLERPASLESPR